ncbi:MAG: hypothetical protein JXA82_03535 [Sedimentisphaerales bacterium]|nr:hypothetical protein [Sedimentisphaerales bacterium]
MCRARMILCISFVAAFLAGSGVVLAAFDTTINLIPNGGFEEDFAYWNSAGASIDTVVFSEGTRSGKLDCSDQQMSDWRSNLYPATPGKEYKLIFDYMTSADSTLAGPEIRHRFYQGNNWKGESQKHLDLTNGEWVTVEMTYLCQPDQDHYDLFFTTNRFSTFKGIVRFDNIGVYPSVDGNLVLHPDPQDGAINVQLDKVLSWDAPLDFPTTATYGLYMVTADLYDSGDPNSMGLAPLVTITDPNITSYDPAGDLAIYTTYYWRVDTTNTATSETFRGPVWSFTTVPPKAYDPVPGDGSTGISLLQILSWGGVPGAESYNVYLGTDQALVQAGDSSVAQGNQVDTAFTPTLDFETQYYWRIDSVLGGTSNAGDVWNFQTAGPQCDPPLAADINNDCLVNMTDLAEIAAEWLSCTLVNANCP